MIRDSFKEIVHDEFMVLIITQVIFGVLSLGILITAAVILWIYQNTTATNTMRATLAMS